MTALATSYDCELRLGRALSTAEAARVDALLTDASSTIRAYTGQTITEEETTERLRSRRARVRLPQRPVADVADVVDLNGTTVPYTWSGLDELELSVFGTIYSWAWEPWTSELTYVDVTYTHGYVTIPDDIVGVCASITLRALGQTPTLGGLTSESIEGYSYQIGAVGAAGGLGLLPEEQRVLDRYRRRAGFADPRYLR